MKYLYSILFIIFGSNISMADEFFNCWQKCGYTDNAPLIIYTTPTQHGTLDLIQRSCANAEKKLFGEAECTQYPTFYNPTNEAYMACVHGTLDGKPLYPKCTVGGYLLIKPPNKIYEKTLSVYGSDLNSFANADRDFSDNCYKIGNRSMNNYPPGTQWECVKLAQEPYLGPY